ncbi:MAG TPA: hypothetical protein VND45_01185 [Thermoanaerobaculia bacterium]|jgi:DNA-binding NtrC family response regulator|nr:hypothetical protein [Thermoanaerobaculia bacterium]
MHHILILDADTPERAELADAVRRAGSADVVLASDQEELVAKVRYGPYAAVFANEQMLPNGAAPLVDAVRSAIVRPMLVIAANEKSEELDAELVTLVVRRPYDVAMLTGVLLSGSVQMRPAAAAARPDDFSVV